MTKYNITPEQAKKLKEPKTCTKLKKLRVRSNLTQSELAKASGISKRTLECYEQGTRQIDGARLETLCDLANALDCKIGDILESDSLIEKHNATK